MAVVGLFRSIRDYRGRHWRLSAAVALVLSVTTISGQAIEEYQFKAAFLYNVAKFVEWPAESFKSPYDPVVGCVLGDSPVRAALREVENSLVIGNRKFAVRRISDPRKTGGCHILFVSASERSRWPEILANPQDQGLLTVGESEGFAAQGGVMNFKLEGEHVRIQVNLEAAERERLRISSRLLSLSQIVKGAK